MTTSKKSRNKLRIDAIESDMRMNSLNQAFLRSEITDERSHIAGHLSNIASKEAAIERLNALNVQLHLEKDALLRKE